MPPVLMARYSVLAISVKVSGLFRAPRSIRVEHPVLEQSDVLGEHAVHGPVDEVRDGLTAVTALAQRMGQRGEGRRGALGERMPGLAGAKALRVRHRPLELVAHGRVREIFEREFVRLADDVRPVGADAEVRHVRDDEMGMGSGEFSRAKAYWWNWSKAASRFTRLPFTPR